MMARKVHVERAIKPGALVRPWVHESSPWKRCEACDRCQWWTGWLCRQESIGFLDCPEYGVSFVETVVARDRATGEARWVTLAKGQTSDDLVEATRQQALEGAVEPFRGVLDASEARLDKCAQQGASEPPRGVLEPCGASASTKSIGINFMMYLQQLKEKERNHG